MPVVKPTPTAAPVAAPTQVRIAAPEHHGVTVDSRYTPSSALLTYVEGAAWTVNYYSQVLGQDSQLNGQQVDAPPPLQQYRLIKQLTMKVTTPLTQSQNLNDAVMIVSGAATLFPGIIPNLGDMFLADVGDGKEGVFQLTLSDKKTIFQDTCYAIEYDLVGYATEERIGDLKSKTVETLHYVSDFVQHGQNPLIQEDAFIAASVLSRRFPQLLQRWVREHVSNEFSTLLVPGQENPVYDPFLTRAVMSFFTREDDHHLSKVRVLNCDDDPGLQAMCLWDALRDQDPSLMVRGFKHAGLMSTLTFTLEPMLEGIRFSGISSVVYPDDVDDDIMFPSGYIPKTLSDTVLVGADTDVVELSELITNLNLDTDDGDPPAIKPVLNDSYYVFSQAFYDRASTGQSLLELSARRYLEAKSLNAEVLIALCNSTSAWGALERFYYVPILLVLVRAYIRGL